MDDGIGVVFALFIVIVLVLGIGIFFGMDIQQECCHKTLSDGRRFVAIEENNGDAYYLLGEKLPEKPKEVYIIKGE